MAAIHEFLSTGKENAKTGRELATQFGCDIRAITQEIERERRAGHPICAASGETCGYYLAADDTELQEYCDRLQGRERELHKTRQARFKVLKGAAVKRAEWV